MDMPLLVRVNPYSLSFYSILVMKSIIYLTISLKKPEKCQTKSSSKGSREIRNEPSMVKIMVMGYDHAYAFNFLLQIHDQNQAVRESVTVHLKILSLIAP